MANSAICEWPINGLVIGNVSFGDWCSVEL